MISGRHSSDHLPIELVKIARSVFDRLSPDSTPIRFHDFALRWPHFRDQFPIVFLDCLRRITPPNGMLTFERFCAGLRLAVAEQKENQKGPAAPVKPGRREIVPNGQMAPAPPIRGPDSMEKTRHLMPIYGSSQSMNSEGHKTDRRGHHPPPYNVALSRSRLNLETIDQEKFDVNRLNPALTRSTPHLCEQTARNGLGQSRMNQGAAGAWQKTNGAQQKSMNGMGQRMANSRPSSSQSTDTNGSLEGIQFRDKSANTNGVVMRNGRANAQDTRRHTMMEGAEASSSQSKHVLLMQEEKSLLNKALDTASRLQTWYNERLSSLVTREKLMGKSMIPLDVAVHEEKLNYLRAHITEVNRRAVALMESSDKGFPWHMNLELHRNIPQPADDQLMWLKRQNRMLTDEVAEKSERIGQLEREKSQLLQKLCESPSTPHFTNGTSSGADSGFHSLNNHSPPNPIRAVPNGHHNASNPVYATPVVNKNDGRFREAPVPRPPVTKAGPHHRVIAELHSGPTGRHGDGVLATFM